MKNKAFTLVELLAVIVILAVILIIAVPQISNVIKKSKYDTFVSNCGMLEKAAETYVVKEGLVITNGASIDITYIDIKTAGLISDILDPSTKTECIGSEVRITNNNGIYKYQSKLVCSNYISVDGWNLVQNINTDNDANGIYDGFSTWSGTDYSLVNGIQKFTPTNQYGGISVSIPAPFDKKIYSSVKIKTTDTNTTLQEDITHSEGTSYPATNNINPNNEFNTTSLYINLNDYTSVSNSSVVIVSETDSNWQPIEFKDLIILNLKEIYENKGLAIPTQEKMDEILKNSGY